jgi:hypothetical protein
MRMLIPLSLIAALAVAPAIAEEEKSVEPAAPTVNPVIPSAESPASTESEATEQTSSATDSQEAPAQDAAPNETVSESQE